MEWRLKMNDDIMDVEELREAYIECIRAVRNKNYKEALKLQDLIYESSYKEYQGLLNKRKGNLSDEEKLKTDNLINLEISNLESMARHAQTIKELNISKTKNEP